jgi:hypothetical protein
VRDFELAERRPEGGTQPSADDNLEHFGGQRASSQPVAVVIPGRAPQRLWASYRRFGFAYRSKLGFEHLESFWLVSADAT